MKRVALGAAVALLVGLPHASDCADEPGSGGREPSAGAPAEPGAPQPPAPGAPPEPSAPNAPSGASVLAHTPAEPSVRWVATAGWDYGFEKLLTVVFQDGSEQSIRANGGLVLSAGAAFLPVLDGRLETQATIGVKYDAIRASNATFTYLAFPLEIVEAWRLPPFRLALGTSISLGPRLSGSGDASDLHLGMKNSLGLLAQAEWSRAFSGGRGRWLLGARYLLQRLQLDEGGPAANANAVGFLVGLVY